MNYKRKLMTEKEFEEYWQKHRKEILAKDSNYNHAKEEFKMHNGADFILFGLPVVAGIVFMNCVQFKSEILTWLSSAAVTIVVYVVCVLVKSMITGVGSPDEMEQHIKEQKKKEMMGNNA